MKVGDVVAPKNELTDYGLVVEMNKKTGSPVIAWATGEVDETIASYRDGGVTEFRTKVVVVGQLRLAQPTDAGLTVFEAKWSDKTGEGPAWVPPAADIHDDDAWGFYVGGVARGATDGWAIIPNPARATRLPDHRCYVLVRNPQETE